MRGDPILYFDGETLVSDWHLLSVGAQREQALHEIGERVTGKPLMLGTLEVGQCIDFKISHGESLGLVIEWSNQLADVGQIVRGG